MQDNSYENSVIYGIDVSRFADGNGDGIGDFGGLIERIPYLEQLGVDCVWLLPFYESPRRDNGYDISDYWEVDSRLGTRAQLIEFVHRAGERGIRDALLLGEANVAP